MKHLHLKILSILKHNPENEKSKQYFFELLSFGYKQALSCLFPVFIFIILAISHFVQINFLFRYDFLLLACLLAQFLLFVFKIESKNELFTITLFHLIGFILESHKVNVGSWSYPEDAITKIGGVPLYAGFMYASVASYLCRAWDNFDLSIKHWPKKRYAILVGIVIYFNFFTNAFILDMRWYITIVLVLVFRRTKVSFNTNGRRRQLPLLASFILIGFFLWLAENIATFFGAWKYTYQHDNWEIVDFQKLTSWSLLIIVSIIMIVQLKHFKSVGYKI